MGLGNRTTLGGRIECHCQVRLTARLDFKVVLAHPGTQKQSLGDSRNPRSFTRPYFTVQRGECVEIDQCDEGGGWGKKEAGLGAALALLFNFKLPLPGKVTPARPSAVLASFASPPLGMDIISRGL